LTFVVGVRVSGVSGHIDYVSKLVIRAIDFWFFHIVFIFCIKLIVFQNS